MKYITKSIRIFASRKLAICLLVMVAIMAAITQISFFQNKGFDRRVFSAWWYNGLLLVLLFNTLVCSLFRLRAFKKKKPRFHDELAKYPNYYSIEHHDASTILYFLKDHLSRKRFKILDLQYNSFLARKGQSYYWGSLVFHLSFIVILIGIILNNCYGFHGTMIVPERQFSSEDHKFYQKIEEGPYFGEKHQQYQIGVESMTVTFNKGKNTASTLEAKVWLMEKHRSIIASQVVKPNQPIQYKGRRILLTGFGYSPYFTLEHNGKVIYQDYINLMTQLDSKGNLQFKDSFFIPKSKIKVNVNLFPNATISQTGKLINVSNNLELPAAEISVTHGNQNLFSGNVFMGQYMKLANGMQFNFQGIKRYGWFDVDYSPGMYFIYVGFILCLLGLLVALFVTPKEIWVSMDSNRIEIAGTSKRYCQLFREEFTGIADLITPVVKDEIKNVV